MTTQKKQKSKWKNYYWFFITAPLSILGGILLILFGHRYNYGALAGFSFIATLSFPSTIYFLYLEPKSSKWYYKMLGVLTLMIIMLPCVFGLIELKDQYDQNQLNKYAVTTYGEVIGYEKTNGRGGTKHYATFTYRYNGELYTQKVGNNDSYYKIGDNLKLTISYKDPEIFSVIGVKRKTNP